jgi:flavin reductase (DIM6/NTAB) family NADH-FMN oxidoreductase RutF
MKRVPGSKFYRLLYPQVPAVVASFRLGAVSAMAAVSVIALSNEPPLVGVSSSPDHATYRSLVGSRSFSLSWLDERYAGAVRRLGSVSGADVGDKLRACGLEWSLRKDPVVPVLNDASAYAVCRVVEVRRYGDHRLIVAGVKEARAAADFRGYWAFEAYRPILYAGMERSAPDQGRVRLP